MVPALFRHQSLALAKSAGTTPPAPGRPTPNEAFAYFMEPGTGKTKVCIEDLARAFARGDIELALVLAPNGVHTNWLRELALHCPLPYRAASYRSGTVNKACREVLEAPPEVLKVIAVNSEALSHKSGLSFCLSVLAGRRCMVILDESHRFKTPGATRTRNVWKLGKMAVLRRLATGTELLKGYEDLYAQFKFLDPTILGHTTFAGFRADYCVEVGEYRQIVGYRNLPQLMARIEPYVFSANKADCLDLPPQVFLQREVELSPEQRRHYKELQERFVTELDSGEVVEATHLLARLTRLQQVIGGHLPDGHGGWRYLPSPRVTETVELAQLARHKVLIWCRFVPDQYRLKEALEKAGLGCVLYNGMQKPEHNDRALADWRTNGYLKVLVGTPSKGGIGLTLNEADTHIFYTHSFNREDRIQPLNRNHRIGQDKPVTVYDLVAPGTLDRKFLRLYEKREDLAALLRDPKTFRAWLLAGD